MEFAINYSPEAAALHVAGQITVDRFKLPDWPHLITEAQQVAPVYIHFPHRIGNGSITAERVAQAQQIAAQTDTPYINMHLLAMINEMGGDSSPAKLKAAAIDAVRLMIDQVGAARVIVENVPYPDRPFDVVPACADPELTAEVIESCDVGLLLDIGHARRSAEYLAIDPRLYIERLPVRRLRELHITGLGYQPDGKRVDHLPMREDDWELFAWVLDQIHAGCFGTPWIVACEYGGVGETFRWRSDSDVIAQEAPRMAQMIKQAVPAAR